LPKLRETGSVYGCCERYLSKVVQLVLEKHLKVRNRIIWEREKGRPAKRSWKNGSEDTWFATVSENHVFDTSRLFGAVL